MRRITHEGVRAAATPQQELLADLEEEREALADRERHLAAVEEALEARQAQVAEARRKLEFAEQERRTATAKLERRFAEIAAREEEIGAVADELDGRRSEGGAIEAGGAGTRRGERAAGAGRPPRG